jgi:hypothetical protein
MENAIKISAKLFEIMVPIIMRKLSISLADISVGIWQLWRTRLTFYIIVKGRDYTMMHLEWQGCIGWHVFMIHDRSHSAFFSTHHPFSCNIPSSWLHPFSMFTRLSDYKVPSHVRHVCFGCEASAVRLFAFSISTLRNYYVKVIMAETMIKHRMLKKVEIWFVRWSFERLSLQNQDLEDFIYPFGSTDLYFGNCERRLLKFLVPSNIIIGR